MSNSRTFGQWNDNKIEPLVISNPSIQVLRVNSMRDLSQTEGPPTFGVLVMTGLMLEQGENVFRSNTSAV